MTEPVRPLPSLDDPDTGQFWQAVQDHRLTYQVCDRCTGVVFYPRAHCTHCGTDRLTVHESAGSGTVYSYTTVRQTPDRAFRPELPYVVAFVDLDEGFRLLTHVLPASDEVRIGQRVRLTWQDVGEVTLPVFHPDMEADHA